VQRVVSVDKIAGKDGKEVIGTTVKEMKRASSTSFVRQVSTPSLINSGPSDDHDAQRDRRAKTRNFCFNFKPAGRLAYSISRNLVSTLRSRELKEGSTAQNKRKKAYQSKVGC
jgi:hypothetical protein